MNQKKTTHGWILLDYCKVRRLLWLYDQDYSSLQTANQKMKVNIKERFACMHKPSSYKKIKIFHLSPLSKQPQFYSIHLIVSRCIMWGLLSYLGFFYSYIRFSEVIALEHVLTVYNLNKLKWIPFSFINNV